MKDKALFKKWWFWAIVVVILGAIGSLGQSGNSANNATKPNDSQQTKAVDQSTLPKLNAEDYKGKEGLVAYKELKGKGYKVEATFEKQALTDINGNSWLHSDGGYIATNGVIHGWLLNCIQSVLQFSATTAGKLRNLEGQPD